MVRKSSLLCVDPAATAPAAWPATGSLQQWFWTVWPLQKFLRALGTAPSKAKLASNPKGGLDSRRNRKSSGTVNLNKILLQLPPLLGVCVHLSDEAGKVLQHLPIRLPLLHKIADVEEEEWSVCELEREEKKKKWVCAQYYSQSAGNFLGQIKSTPISHSWWPFPFF